MIFSWACNVCWWSSTCMGRVNMEGQIQVNSAGQATVWSRDRVFTLQTKCPQAVQIANCRNLGVASPQCSAIHWNCLLNVALSLRRQYKRHSQWWQTSTNVPCSRFNDPCVLSTSSQCHSQHMHPLEVLSAYFNQPWRFPIHCCCGFFMKPSSYWGYTIWFLHSWIDAPHAPKYSGEATEPKTCSIASWVLLRSASQSLVAVAGRVPGVKVWQIEQQLNEDTNTIIYIYVYVYVYVMKRIYIYAYSCALLCRYVYIYIYIYMYLFIYVCTYTIYIYITFIHWFVHSFIQSINQSINHSIICSFVPSLIQTIPYHTIPTHKHTQIYKHTHTHTHIHTYKHTNMQTCKHANMHTWIHAYMNTWIHEYIHTYIPTYLHT